jgi:hypothetical protein
VLKANLAMADLVSDDSGQKVEKDPVLVDINKKVLDAFDIFDHDGNKTVDVR